MWPFLYNLPTAEISNGSPLLVWHPLFRKLGNDPNIETMPGGLEAHIRLEEGVSELREKIRTRLFGSPPAFELRLNKRSVLTLFADVAERLVDDLARLSLTVRIGHGLGQWEHADLSGGELGSLSSNWKTDSVYVELPEQPDDLDLIEAVYRVFEHLALAEASASQMLTIQETKRLRSLIRKARDLIEESTGLAAGLPEAPPDTIAVAELEPARGDTRLPRRQATSPTTDRIGPAGSEVRGLWICGAATAIRRAMKTQAERAKTEYRDPKPSTLAPLIVDVLTAASREDADPESVARLLRKRRSSATRPEKNPHAKKE